VTALDAWHQQHLRSPSAWEWWSAGPDHPSHWTVRQVFGSWSAALTAAGLRARARGDVRVRTQRERCPHTGRFVPSAISSAPGGPASRQAAR